MTADLSEDENAKYNQTDDVGVPQAEEEEHAQKKPEPAPEAKDEDKKSAADASVAMSRLSVRSGVRDTAAEAAEVGSAEEEDESAAAKGSRLSVR